MGGIGEMTGPIVEQKLVSCEGGRIRSGIRLCKRPAGMDRMLQNVHIQVAVLIRIQEGRLLAKPLNGQTALRSFLGKMPLAVIDE